MSEAATETSDLEPCPFCGNENLDRMLHDLVDVDSSSLHYAVECLTCGCEGPEASTAPEADRLWNRRDSGQLVDPEVYRGHTIERASDRVWVEPVGPLDSPRSGVWGYYPNAETARRALEWMRI